MPGRWRRHHTEERWALPPREGATNLSAAKGNFDDSRGPHLLDDGEHRMRCEWRRDDDGNALGAGTTPEAEGAFGRWEANHFAYLQAWEAKTAWMEMARAFV